MKYLRKKWNVPNPRWGIWILLGLILLPGFISLALDNDRAMKMTSAQEHALWNEALRYAFLEDDWLGRPSGEIALSWNDDTYTPSVDGLSFRKATDSHRRKLIEQYGQYDSVSLLSLDFGTGPTSLVVMLHRRLELSRARHSNGERGCFQRSWLGCKGSGGGWACETVIREGTECNEFAYDYRRWQTLPGLTMTREDDHALWNQVLRYALLENEWLGRPSEPIPLVIYGPDPAYRPQVGDLTFELLGMEDVRALANTAGEAEFVRAGGYTWYRGPITMHFAIERSFESSDARKMESKHVWSRNMTVKCQPSSDGWSCTGVDKGGSD
jgi:hypothetical protein